MKIQKASQVAEQFSNKNKTLRAPKRRNNTIPCAFNSTAVNRSKHNANMMDGLEPKNSQNRATVSGNVINGEQSQLLNARA